MKWEKSANESGSEVGITVHADNYDSSDFKDTARISLDSFTYYLNALQISLKANLQFGGILSPIPDIGSFPIYSFIIDTGTFGIPIPQHPGTEAVEIDVPVENYGLKVDVKPESTDPAVRVDDKTLLISPGENGAYDVRVRNIGSRNGSFDNFRVDLSNRPEQTSPYRFGVDPNTDHDCVATGSSCIGGTHFRGDRTTESRMRATTPPARCCPDGWSVSMKTRHRRFRVSAARSAMTTATDFLTRIRRRCGSPLRTDLRSAR